MRTAVAMCMLTIAAGKTAVAQTTQPESTGPLQFVQVIRDGDGGVEFKDHVGPVVVRGEFVYAAVVYRGQLKWFKRDEATGRLDYLGSADLEDNKTSMRNLVWAGGRLYFNGGVGHWTGDRDSRGLQWFDVDQKTGRPTLAGKIDIPISGEMFASADGRNLYLSLPQKNALVRYTLGPDGKPAKDSQVTLPVPQGSKHVSMHMTPDGWAIYIMCGARDFCLFCVPVGKDGSLGEVKGPWELTELTAGIDWPQGKWGYGWGRGFQFSPDGRQIYANFNNYGAKDCRMALYERDAATGAVTFKQRIDDKTGLDMVRIMGMAWDDDGKIGYYVSGPESSGNGVGWCTRDPKTGVLTFGGMVPETKRSGPNNLCFDAAHNALYAGAWNAKCLFVMKTAAGDK